jgi:hypothetical protein
LICLAFLAECRRTTNPDGAGSRLAARGLNELPPLLRRCVAPTTLLA